MAISIFCVRRVNNSITKTIPGNWVLSNALKLRFPALCNTFMLPHIFTTFLPRKDRKFKCFSFLLCVSIADIFHRVAFHVHKFRAIVDRVTKSFPFLSPITAVRHEKGENMQICIFVWYRRGKSAARRSAKKKTIFEIEFPWKWVCVFTSESWKDHAMAARRLIQLFPSPSLPTRRANLLIKFQPRNARQLELSWLNLNFLPTFNEVDRHLEPVSVLVAVV